MADEEEMLRPGGEPRPGEVDSGDMGRMRMRGLIEYDTRVYGIFAWCSKGL